MAILTADAFIAPILPELDEPLPLDDAPVTIAIGVTVLRPGDGQGIGWLRISGLPAGSALSAGVPDGDGWLLDAAALAPFLATTPDGYLAAEVVLVLTPPPGHLGTFDVAALAQITEPGQPASYVSAVTPAPAAGLAEGHAFAGGEGADRFRGLDGADTLAGLGGDDELTGLWGSDVLEGGSGDDRLDGGDDADLLAGGEGADEATGGHGDDTLDGGAGDDFLAGQDGNDRLTGGSGADRFVFQAVFEPGFGHDVVADFDPGEDRLEVAFDPAWTLADIRAATVQAGDDVLVAAGEGSTVTVLGADAEAVFRNLVGEAAYLSWTGP